MHRVYIYRRYVRLWHWVQAAAVFALMLSGLVIHNPGTGAAARFHTAVTVHHSAALLLFANGALGLFFYITTGEIRQLLPRIHGFVEAVLAQVRYYTYGIFHGEEYPFEKTPAQRLNMLQRITYLTVMVVLLPVQVMTGALLWVAGHQAEALYPGMSLATLSVVHTLAAWLFTAFLIMHIYLTTTGRTPLANIQTMITGWEEGGTPGRAPGRNN